MRAIVLALLPVGIAAAADFPEIASYDIDAKLIPAEHAVDGHEVLTWRNESPDYIRELQFHLYQNAFRNTRSTFLRESAGATGSRSATASAQLRKTNGWGWIDIRSLRIENGPDVAKSIRYLHPDDDNADDRTVMAVDLPEPLKPGGTIHVTIDFRTKLPRGGERAGWQLNYHLFGQWFPKIGVWERAGVRGAAAGHWNCHQYHANSEFYADFGRYAVNITTPSNYVVGASGVLERRTDNKAAGTTTRRYVQDGIHDFAWTASPDFIRVERLFDPKREVSEAELAATARMLGITEDEARLQPVRMILLIQPDHASQIDRHFRAIATGLKYFGLWYGKYPYQTITVVDPAYGASNTGGMEYPTFITAGTNWILEPHGQTPEMVVVHEFGHEYWYGMVASNEFEEAWLDEGFNTYSTSKILDKVYGPFPLPVAFQRIPASLVLRLPESNWDSVNRAAWLAMPKADALARNSWQYYSGSSYGLNVYMRTGVTLRTLENLLGEQTMARVMRTYFQRWKYKHPTTSDFIAVVNEVSGKEMTSFFDQFFYGSDLLDYAVGSVQYGKDEKTNVWDTNIKIVRNGEAIWPVDVRISFKDGDVVLKRWDGRYRWVEYSFKRPSEPATVEVDPDHKLLLDVNFANNSWQAEMASKPMLKWTGNLLFWVQNVLLSLAGMA